MKDVQPPAPGVTDRSSIARFFDEMATTRNALFRSNPILDYEQRVRSDAVIERIAAGPNETILDIGCGNARDIVPMLRHGATIVGVDLSDGMIRQAQLDLAAAGYEGVRLEVGDATNLHFEDAAFDKIVCSEVIEHIPDARAAVREMRRVLKPGGTLVMSTPNRHSWYGLERYVIWQRLLRRAWNHPFDNWRTMAELCALLEEEGFQVTSRATVCYMPGFLLTYRLPSHRLRGLVARCTGRAEPLASRLAPRRGYLLVVSAVNAR